MIDLSGRPFYKLFLAGLYTANLLVLIGIAAVATDPRLDWHDYLYPAFVGSGLLMFVELLILGLLRRRREPGNLETFGWLWIFTAVFLVVTAVVWIFTFQSHQADLAQLIRPKNPPAVLHLGPKAADMLGGLQRTSAGGR